MIDRVAEVASFIDSVCVPVARARVAEMGPDASGAYNFYVTRLERETLFGDYELAVARRLLEWPDAPRKIHEVGVGWGQLSFLLTLLGFETVALEADERRFTAGVALYQALAQAAPALAMRGRFSKERFPTPNLKPDGALFLTTNIVFTMAPDVRAQFVRALTAYDQAIVDLDRFINRIDTEEARQALLTEFAGVGFEHEPFCDLGDSARFHLLRGERGRGRPGPPPAKSIGVKPLRDLEAVDGAAATWLANNGGPAAEGRAPGVPLVEALRANQPAFEHHVVVGADAARVATLLGAAGLPTTAVAGSVDDLARASALKACLQPRHPALAGMNCAAELPDQDWSRSVVVVGDAASRGLVDLHRFGAVVVKAAADASEWREAGFSEPSLFGVDRRHWLVRPV